MKAIRVHQPGGPENMVYEDVPMPSVGQGQALVKLRAIGVNYMDIYLRQGAQRSTFPLIPGGEGAGVVEATGQGVTEVRVGDLVAYTGAGSSYAEHVVVPSWRLVKLPQGVDASMGAASILQGMTAHYLANSTYPLKAGDTCLVHAAAGGVGLLLVQMAKMRGARVIATVSTSEKAKLAAGAGADEVVNYTEQDFEAEVKRITGGKGCQVVYDAVGKATFDKSLASLAPRGLLALYGAASGPVPPLDINRLGGVMSLSLTRPSLTAYTATREELLLRAGELFSWIGSGKLKVRIEETFKLSSAVEAHRKLEGRLTAGKLLLVP
ncbi:MAG: quinone oxidoreductase [Dehalococcoidia bacterium]|nr:quinone oxidoreductase [Dehalococcoidia bacterium]MSQ34987.1 quinone oxidoreductase [Dehalococcoidia bacterium]